MNVKQIAAAGALAALVLGAGATSASASTTTPVTAPARCLPAGHDDAWPVWADGRPDRDPGVRVWHDSLGWHVRVTHDTIHDRVFSGEIATTGDLVDVHAVRLEKNDHVVVGSGKHTIAFRFNNYGGVDGFDFVTHCAPFVSFGFASDGHVVPAARVSVGSTGRHPAGDPFVISRRP